MKKLTQTNSVRAHLESGRELTPLDALNLYGTFRLSAIIFNLRKEMNIITNMKSVNGSSFASYKVV